MANKSLEIVTIKEIIRLKSQGVSNKQIARAIKSSRTTVIKYLKLFEATGLSLEVLDRWQAILSVHIGKAIFFRSPEWHTM